jgi:glycosyltransferase involved in cell wall biosynthesis/GT2 family glycosyltransferase
VRDLARGEVVVCIPVFGALDLFEQCLASVVRHTSPDVPIIVADDATPGDEVARLLENHAVRHLRSSVNRGFVENVNSAIKEAGHADVVVVNSDVVVGPQWLDGLRAAAASDSRIATVTALADDASIVSVDAGSLAVDDAAEAVREGSLGLRPQLPTAIGHCFLVTRAALDLVGDFDTAFSPGYGEEVDFSQRCLARGMIHVLADDVWVHHRGRGTFSERAAELRAEHDAIVERRYPWYRGAVRRAGEGAPADAVGAARRALRPLSVTIDGSTLGPVTMGSQVATLELVRALSRLDGVDVRVALPPDPGGHAREVLGELGAELVPVASPGARTDVVHRPAQVAAPVNLAWLHALGERIVISQLDLIAYSNPSYFESFEDWDELRTLTRQSLAIADAGVFISDFVRREVVSEELLAPERAHVVYPGIDHGPGPEPSRPTGVPDGDFLLLLGADFTHKNRAFGIELFVAMRERGWQGALVLAGPHVSHGSDEATLPAASGVVQLGAVSEAEKAWLYGNAALALYPTVSEGFGLVPFEAAAAGTACMFAPVTALAEVLDPELATLVPWDAGAGADRALALLADRAQRQRLAASISEHGRRYTWDAAARQLLDVYRQTLTRPARPARAALLGAGARSHVADALVGPGGHLPPDIQRALLAISTRPALRGPVFAALRASYRALKRARRGG